MPPVVSQSSTTQDALTAPGACGSTAPGALPGRCGYGPRLPLLVISPFAKQNYVDHETTDQSSILRFIEDNWNLGRLGGQSFDARAGSLSGLFDFGREGDDESENSVLQLDPLTGQPAHGKDQGD
jgi:phospholipase C